MKRVIELYGRLRDAGHGAVVRAELPPRATARQTLAALRLVLGEDLAGCVLAATDCTLAPNDRVPAKGRLAVLPPVCGG
ncbi:MAG: hypothetical protein HY923_10650 [Elusimicrobia bacterium]|nr:hypothetical protein [Elusimicrobiota bacterium]